MNYPDPPDKKLDKEDQKLWDSFTEDIAQSNTPLEEENFEQLLKEDLFDEKHLSEKAKTSVQEKFISKKKKSSEFPHQLDRRTEEKLCKGKIPIEGRIDLHGMTQAKAHEVLNQFINTSIADEKRCVLVITGKGKSKATSEDWLSPGQGILKQCVPEWLSSPPFHEHVLKTMIAQPKDGGSGALYVYLKRQR